MIRSVIKFWREILIATGKALMILNRDLLVFSKYIDSSKIGRAPGNAGKRGRLSGSAWSTSWRICARRTGHSKASWSSWGPRLRRRTCRMIPIQNRTNRPATPPNSPAAYPSKWSSKRSRPQVCTGRTSSVPRCTAKTWIKSTNTTTPIPPGKASYREYRRPRIRTKTCCSTRNFSVSPMPRDLSNSRS